MIRVNPRLVNSFLGCLAVLVCAGAVHAEQIGRLVTYRPFSSRFVDAREVDVWLPPGYDQNASGLIQSSTCTTDKISSIPT